MIRQTHYVWFIGLQRLKLRAALSATNRERTNDATSRQLSIFTARPRSSGHQEDISVGRLDILLFWPLGSFICIWCGPDRYSRYLIIHTDKHHLLLLRYLIWVMDYHMRRVKLGRLQNSRPHTEVPAVYFEIYRKVKGKLRALVWVGQADK